LRIMLAEPAAGAQNTLRHVPAASAVQIFVGPEGGWTSDETAAAVRSGCILLTLGGTTLRADAVPIVAITALRALWNDF
jgi:16S rRNA (uracil1498-N3)-methyltransferase